MKRQQSFIAALIAFSLIFAPVGAGFAQSGKPRPKVFSKQGPVRLDFDMASIKQPQTYETGYLWDFSNNTFFRPVKKLFNLERHARSIAGERPESLNVNTLDEVPDSSWFTNRNGVRRMSLEEIKRGPNVTDGPAPGRLTVVRGKTNGITPGFQVKDERGDVYLLKFDPPGYPELSSAAEAISTRLFYAIGYNVPQNTVFNFRREQLVVDPKAKFTDERGVARKFEDADVDRILKLAARRPDGSYRCLASKFLAGKPVGNFKFYGTRDDDPNDTIPHQHRRDLRALRVFAAWLNHNDIRDGNTLDMFVREGGREFVRHHLIDFGSTLGSDTTGPNPNEVGHAHQIDFGEAGKSLVTLGIYQPHWRKGESRVRFESVGNYSADRFVPHDWKSNFPVPAFENMTDRDAYWAAKIVASFTDEQIRAAVETGRLSDPQAAAYLIEQIIRRRDAIVREYISRRAALDHLRLQDKGDGWRVNFSDLRAQFIRNDEPSYEYELAAVENPGRVLARGTLGGTYLDLASPLLKEMAGCGRTPEDRGVARLRLKRKGESRAMTAWLFYDEARDALSVVGQQN
jgi:hypothetical protein